jgi:UDP-N-acetylmuramoylalanine--D-glutamate ligase
MEAYTAAKARILSFQHQSDFAILNRDDQGSWNLFSNVRGKLFSFGMDFKNDIENGTYVENGKIFLKKADATLPIIDNHEIKIRGQHNLYNTLAAVAICGAADLPTESIKRGIQNFTGVEHRQEFVRQWHGITWINDSIATAPERVMAALDVFTEPLVLMLGGKDKNLPWDDLAKRIHQRVAKVILFGEAAEKIEAALGHPKDGETLMLIINAGSFENALKKAYEVAVSGDVVLLSPGCTSYDAFKDFEERGNYFKNWVKEL